MDNLDAPEAPGSPPPLERQRAAEPVELEPDSAPLEPPLEEPPLEEPPEAEPEAPAPKRRGRPKAPPMPKAAPKPRGRPRKVTIVEEPEVQTYVPPSADQLHSYVAPLLQAYAAHLQLNQQAQKRQRYRDLFSSVYG